MSDALTQMQSSLAKLTEAERMELLRKLGVGRQSARRPVAPREAPPATPLNPTRTDRIRSEVEWV